MTGIAWRAVECYDLVSTLVIWRLLRDRFNRPAFSSSAPQFVSQFRTQVEVEYRVHAPNRTAPSERIKIVAGAANTHYI
jgi:hypothetical protein